MKKGSGVVLLCLMALFGFALTSGSSTPRRAAKWRSVRIKFFESQEPAVPTFIDELEDVGEVSDMHFGDELLLKFRGPEGALSELVDRYGFSIAEEKGPLDAVIYGAEWCQPCHVAEKYLKERGVNVVKKDVDEDPAALAEMNSKLQSAGLSGGMIPILDVGGTIIRTFDKAAVDRALAS